MSIQAVAWALEQTLVKDSGARFVLIGLANHADANGRHAFPSIATLAHYTGMSTRSVKAKLAMLKEQGIIAEGNQGIAAAHISRADRRPTVYDILMVGEGVRGEQISPRSAENKERGEICAGNGVKSVQERGEPRSPEPSLNRPKEEPTSSPTASNEDLDAAFDIFWTAGLRKDAKKKARAAFARLVKGKDAAAFAERLAEDIRRRVAAGQLGIDRMLPTTYLNGERWEDEAPEVCPHAEILDAWNAEMPDHIEKLTPDDWLPDSKGFQRLAAAWENFKTKPRTTTGRPVFTSTEDGVDFYREVFRRMSLVDRIQRADAASWCKLSWAVQQDVTIKAFKGELV